jgi:hypothetical protein
VLRRLEVHHQEDHRQVDHHLEGHRLEDHSGLRLEDRQKEVLHLV